MQIIPAPSGLPVVSRRWGVELAGNTCEIPAFKHVQLMTTVQEDG